MDVVLLLMVLGVMLSGFRAADTALGYYVNTGLQIKPVKRRDQYIVLRAQFEAAHHAGLGLPLYNAWSGAIGYTF